MRVPDQTRGVSAARKSGGGSVRQSASRASGPAIACIRSAASRTVRDAALLMQAIAGPDARDALCLTEPPPDFLAALTPRVWSGTRMALSLDYGHMDVDPE